MVVVVELPKIMRSLPRDSRGLPVPFNILWVNGTPLFTANDGRKVHDCVSKHLCSICGKRLKEAWFISGSRAFLHNNGTFLDPPIHYGCGEYALMVCPFLAASSWNRSIGKTMLKQKPLPRNIVAIEELDWVGQRLPEWFGLGLAGDYRIETIVRRQQYSFHVTDWQYVEFWKSGKPVNAPSADDVRQLLIV